MYKISTFKTAVLLSTNKNITYPHLEPCRDLGGNSFISQEQTLQIQDENMVLGLFPYTLGEVIFN